MWNGYGSLELSDRADSLVSLIKLQGQPWPELSCWKALALFGLWAQET